MILQIHPFSEFPLQEQYYDPNHEYLIPVSDSEPLQEKSGNSKFLNFEFDSKIDVIQELSSNHFLKEDLSNSDPVQDSGKLNVQHFYDLDSYSDESNGGIQLFY